MYRSVCAMICLGGLLVLTGCAELTELRKQNAALKVRLQEVLEENEQIQSVTRDLGAERASLSAQLEAERKENAQLAELAGRVQDLLAERELEKAELQKLVKTMAGIGLRSDRHGNYIVLENSILFEPGKVELTAAAKETLSTTVVAYLKQHPEQEVRIDGHTDGVPITHSHWADLHQLGAMRAHSVFQHLVASGISSQRMVIAGMGSNRPAVEPPSPQADVPENRRVEILLIPRAGRSIDDILSDFTK